MPSKYYYYCTLAILISFHVGYSAAYSSSYVQSKLSWLLTLDQKDTKDGGRNYNLHLNNRNKKNSNGNPFWYKTTSSTATPLPSSFSSLSTRLLRVPRGGGEGEMDPSNTIMEDRTLSMNEKQKDDPILLSSSSMSGITNFPMVSSLLAFGTFYASSLQSHPILTKSLTAGIIFALSDGLAQKLEGSRRPTTTTTASSTNWVRLGASALVGFAYFGPAAHYWYEAIFALLPGTSLLSTIVKAALGQVIFGPIFTCIFFASALLQTYGRQFRLQMWFRKIRNDLPGAWAAGLGFWPLVDLISYSVVPPAWIPLFINMCSLVWTVYLSRVANQSA